MACPAVFSMPPSFGLKYQYPKIEVGETILNRAVDEFFTEAEQIAFCTAHVVPDVPFSDDPLLHCNFSYFDTQITCLGPSIPSTVLSGPSWISTVTVLCDTALPEARSTTGQIVLTSWPHKFDHTEAIEYPQSVHGVKQRYRGPSSTSISIRHS